MQMSGASRQKEPFSQVPALSPITWHEEGHCVLPPSVQTPPLWGRRQLQACCPLTPGSQAGRMRPCCMGIPHPLWRYLHPRPWLLKTGDKIAFFFQPMNEWYVLCQNQTVPAKGLSRGQKIMRWDRKPWKNMLGLSGWKELGAVAYWP